MGFLNRTGAEVGYSLEKKMQKNNILLLKKFKKTGSSQLWRQDISQHCRKVTALASYLAITAGL